MLKPFSDKERTLMLESVRSFCRKEILPHVREWDEKAKLPRALFRSLGSLGLMGILIPSIHQGAQLNYSTYISLIEEIARVDPSVALSVAAHNSLCVGHISSFGTTQQKERFLPRLASGEHLGAWACTEPSSGSDAHALKTRARKKGKTWVLNGTKNFITHGKTGDVFVILAKTEDDKHTAFVVEKGTQGLRAGKTEDKLGMRASETAELILEDCIVPDENLIGKEGEGFKQAMGVLEGGRISIGALALGTAVGAYETALKYSQERYQFGKPISSFQAISFKLSDMHMEIEAARLLLKSAAEQKDEGESVIKSSSMAKYYASEVSVRVSNEAVQIMGGYGYVKDFPVEKFYRDSKLCTIGEGTSEIQKLIISRQILGS
ncbi:MAG: acyl-CoA dehydrogenase family protein [Cytophagales bacterium]|nr:acyl-CoA dehydrogenase family protein [Cytophagales bacterium]